MSNKIVTYLYNKLFNSKSIDSECKSYYYKHNKNYTINNIEELFIKMSSELDEIKLLYNIHKKLYCMHTQDQKIIIRLSNYIGLGVQTKQLDIKEINTTNIKLTHATDDINNKYNILYYSQEINSSILSQRI